jgi:hypothetical protein
MTFTQDANHVLFRVVVQKNILATISCAAGYSSASIYWAVRKFFQHYLPPLLPIFYNSRKLLWLLTNSGCAANGGEE